MGIPTYEVTLGLVEVLSNETTAHSLPNEGEMSTLGCVPRVLRCGFRSPFDSGWKMACYWDLRIRAIHESGHPLPLQKSATRNLATNLRQGEYIEHSPFVRVMRKILHRCRESQSRGFIASIQPAGHDRSRPTADSGQDGDVLFPIWSFVGCGLADNSGPGFELP